MDNNKAITDTSLESISGALHALPCLNYVAIECHGIFEITNASLKLLGWGLKDLK